MVAHSTMHCAKHNMQRSAEGGDANALEPPHTPSSCLLHRLTTPCGKEGLQLKCAKKPVEACESCEQTWPRMGG